MDLEDVGRRAPGSIEEKQEMIWNMIRQMKECVLDSSG